MHAVLMEVASTACADAGTLLELGDGRRVCLAHPPDAPVIRANRPTISLSTGFDIFTLVVKARWRKEV